MTKIPYCEMTWPLTAGCTKCSPGCKNDWAERMAKRLKGKGIRGYDKVVDKDGWTNHIELMPWNLDKPLHWRKPRRIFVNSMSDLFHPKVPFEFIAEVFLIAQKCKQHTFLFFTKRIERALEFYKWDYPLELMKSWGQLKNIQLILSLSTQKEADEKIPIILQIPAAVRGLSLEPLLEPIDFVNGIKYPDGSDWWNGFLMDTNDGIADYLHWVIVGGESGPKARPMHPDWARSIRDQCVAAGVPFYFKQWGEWWPENQIDSYVVHCSHPPFRFDDSLKSFRVGKKKAGDLLDGKEWKQYP